jgi:hypothetical protein
MKSQIFRTSVPICVVSQLLDTIAEKNEHHYTVTNDSFKKAMFLDVVPHFIEDCLPHYHLSKQYFLQNMKDSPSFVNLLTLLKQIYRQHDMKYERVLKYEKGSYIIVYKFQIM